LKLKRKKDNLVLIFIFAESSGKMIKMDNRVMG